MKPPSYATCLAVHENECAIVRKSNLTDRSPQYVGSDWATTCVMLILETDEHVCCLHHDSPDETAVRMQQALYYLGQYCDLVSFSLARRKQTTLIHHALVAAIESILRWPN